MNNGKRQKMSGTQEYFFPILLSMLLFLKIIIGNIQNHRDQARGSLPSNVEKPDSQDITKWQLLIDAWNKESDRFWARNNIFLAVNGALLVAVTSFLNAPILALLVSLFGIIFVLIWVKVINVGKYYQDRWLTLIEQIESTWETKFITQFKRVRTTDRNLSKLKSSTTYMLYVLRLLLTLWLTISVYESILIYLANPIFFDGVVKFIQVFP